MSYSRQRRRILSPATRLQGVTPPPTPVGPIDPRLMMSSGLRDTMRAEEDAYNQRDQDQAYLAQQQAREQERADKAAEAAQKKAEAQSQKLSTYAKKKEYDAAGINSEMDALGNVVAKKDAMTGKTDYRDMQAPVQYPETGKPYQMKRGEDGKMKQEFPDAKAPIGNNPNDPTDPAIYRMNKAAPWDRIDPQEGLLSPEPEVKRESSRRLLDDERKALQRESEGLGIEMRNPDNKLPSPEKLAEMRARAGSEYADPKEAETLKRADERDAKLRRQNEIATRNLALETTSPDDYAAERLAKLDPKTVQAKRADLMTQKSAGIKALEAKLLEEEASLQADYQAFVPQTQGFRADQEAGIREKLGQFRLRKQMVAAKRQSLEQSFAEFNKFGKDIYQQATAASQAKAEKESIGTPAVDAKPGATKTPAPALPIEQAYEQAKTGQIPWKQSMENQRSRLEYLKADGTIPETAKVAERWQQVLESMDPEAGGEDSGAAINAAFQTMQAEMQAAGAKDSAANEKMRNQAKADAEYLTNLAQSGESFTADTPEQQASAEAWGRSQFTFGNEDSPANYAPWGELTVNPSLIFRPDQYTAAVEGVTAPPLAKERAMQALPAMQAAAAGPIFQGFMKAGGIQTAFLRSIQKTAKRIGIPIGSSSTPDLQALAVQDFMASDGFSPNWNQVAIGASRGLDQLRQQAAGLGSFFGSAGSQKYGEQMMTQQENLSAAAQAGGGSGTLGQVVSGATSLAPSLAVGVLSGGLGFGKTGALVASSLAAGAQSTGSTMIEARKAGWTQRDAMGVAALSGAITGGLTAGGRATGSEAVFKKLFAEKAQMSAIRPAFKAMLIDKLKSYGVEGLKEVAEEVPDQFLQNALQSVTYKPGQDLTEGLVDTAVVSFILGSGMNAATDMAKSAGDRLDAKGLIQREGVRMELGRKAAMQTPPEIIAANLAGSPMEAQAPEILSSIAEIDARIVDGQEQLAQATKPAAKLYSTRQLAQAYGERQKAVVDLKQKLRASFTEAAIAEIDAAQAPEGAPQMGMATLPTPEETAFENDKLRAKALVAIATGETDSLDDSSLALVDLARDDKGVIVQAKGKTDSPGGIPRVKMENGAPIIGQDTIDRMTALFPKTEPLIGKTEGQQRAEIQAKVAAEQAAKAAPQKDTKADVPTAEKPQPVQGEAAKPAPVGTKNASPATGKQTFAVEVEGLADPVMMDAANVEQAKDLAFAAFPGKIINGVKATGPAPKPDAAPAPAKPAKAPKSDTAKPADQPSPNLPPKATENAPPRPVRGDMSRQDFVAASDAWDDKYMATHNGDGTPIQPTVLDEVAQKALAALKDKTYDERLDSIGTDTGAEMGTGLQQLINDGWVWGDKTGKMVDPQNRGQTPYQALQRIRGHDKSDPKAPSPETAPAVSQNKTPASDTAAPDVTPAGITKALAATVKGKPSKRQAKRFVVAGQAISKEIARWKAAFPGGISLVTGTPSSGVLMGRKKLELLLDMPRLAESIEALGDNPLGWVEDAMIEEAIHAVVEKLVQEGKLDLMGIWNEIPAETKATTLKAYTSNSDPENQAHEYFRLWLQHRLQQAKGGKGNPAFTEANFPAKAYALLKDALNTLLDYFRDMAGTLRKQGASEDTIGRVMASGDLIEAMVRALDAEAKAAPVAAPAAPEVNDKAGSDASVDPNAVVGTFTTAKGSTYKIYGDGTTERNKAARDDVGHEGDSGAKPRTVRTIYVAGDASSLSAAGLTLPNPEKGARVIIKDGKASMLTWNDAAGQWGVAPESRDIAFFDEPAVGRSPLELWRPKTDVQGYEAYSGMHAGNKITKITTATNEQNNQAALTPEEQTLKDLLSGVIDGTIQSQPIVAPYSRDIPESIFVTVLSTVRGMVNKGIDTPEKLGASLTKMGPAFRQFSEAIWSGMGMTSSALRAITPNWDTIYTALDKPAAAASPEPAPATKPPVDDRVFDADYTGPRWTYGMRNRPVGIGAAPKGYIIGSGGPAVGRARNGTIQYPRKLTSQELYDFEMELMEQPETPALDKPTKTNDTTNNDTGNDSGNQDRVPADRGGLAGSVPADEGNADVLEGTLPAAVETPDGSGSSATLRTGDGSESNGAGEGTALTEQPVSTEPSNAGSAGRSDGAGGKRGGKRKPGSKPPVAQDLPAPGEKAPSRANYHLSNPEIIMGGGPKAKFARNQKAIEVYQDLRTANREPTAEELDTLAGYMGWGAFGQELFNGNWARPQPKSGWEKEDTWLRDHLGQKEWEGLQTSIINAHYTDPPTVNAVWSILKALGFKGGRTLEPSIGIGNFYGLMPRDIAANSQLTGIEMDSVSGGMAKILYPQANIQIKPYEQSKTSDGFYDLIIGNWPFSDGVPVDKRYNNIGAVLHDYFFIKALDQARPGGLVVGITSNGTMDKKGKRSRMEMAKRGKLIAAFRLPTGAFKEYAGTSVVTDILVFQKLDKPGDPRESGFLDLQSVPTPSGTPVEINEYFAAHPDHILGTLNYGHGTTSYGPGMIVDRTPDLPGLLAEIANKLPEGAAYQPAAAVGQASSYVTNNTNDRQGSIVLDKNSLYVVDGEHLKPLADVVKYQVKDAKKTQKRESQIAGLVQLRRTVGKLLDAQRKGDDATEIRKSLNDNYDAFVKAHGPINLSDGLSIMDRANDPFSATLAALEQATDDKKKWIKRDIFTKDVLRGVKTLENPTIADAYALARNNSLTLNLASIAAKANTTTEAVEAELFEKGQIFRTPVGTYEPSDIYLAGNVREKYREALDAQEQGVPGMDRNMAALAEVIPADIPYFQIESKIGATWVSTRDYVQFAGYLLNTSNGVTIDKVPEGWKIQMEKRLESKPEATTTWGVQNYSFRKLLSAAMNNATITIKYPKQDDGSQPVNVEATKAANGKVDAIKEEFQKWIWSDPERAGRLEKNYNEVFNAIAIPRYDGSHLAFEGLSLEKGDKPFNLRQHQQNAVWRAVVTGRSLNAHEVGTGKTLVMAGLVMESRRLGRARKPMILAHNANARQVAAEIQSAYPGGKILFVNNFNPDTRAATLAQIALDEWDAVVLPHSLISRLSLRPESVEALVREQIEELEQAAMEAATDDNTTLTIAEMNDPDALKRLRSPTAKELVKEREKIKALIEKARQLAEKPDSVFFEDLGVDLMVIDEAHIFKKLPLPTKMKLKGLNKNGSNRGMILGLLADYVKRNNNGSGIHLFTGTPITNTLNEVFNMMRYIMDDVMKRDGIGRWDDWFNSFAASTTEVELNSAGEWEAVERLSSFVNLPELRRMIGQYLDIVFADDMPEFKPRDSRDGRTEDAIGRPFKQVINDIGPMSGSQRVHKESLAERYRRWKSMSGRDKRDAMRAGAPEVPIIIEGEGVKSSMDFRLIEKNALDDGGSKAARATRNILKHYGEHPKSTQMVFMQTGFSDFVERGGKNGKPKIRVPVFNVAKDIKARLIEGGIKEEEIVIFSDLSADERKIAAEKMQQGLIRVAIGSTETMGTGVNAQIEMRAMHHMDAPWMPGDLEQRNGRGWRQGNRWNTVYEYRYITEASHDGRRWQILLTKDRFIKLFMKADGSMRTIEGDGVDMEEEGGGGFEETFSAAAGDPRILMREKLSKDVNKLLDKQRSHWQAIAEAKTRIESLERDIRFMTARLPDLSTDADTYAKAREAAFSVVLDGKTYTELEPANVALLDAMERLPIQESFTMKVQWTKLGTYRGFDVMAFRQRALAGAEPIRKIELRGATDHEARSVAMGSMDYALRQIAVEIEAAGKLITERKTSILSLEKIAGTPFGRQAELEKRQKQLADITADLSANPTPAPSWLRNGAPVGTSVFIEGKEYGVIGHRVADGTFYVLVDKGESVDAVDYLQLQNESGIPLFESVEDSPAEKPSATIQSQSPADFLAQAQAQDALPEAIRYMGITDVVQAIRDGNTDTPLRAVNQVIEDAAALRERVRAESERRAQPRQTGKPAIMDQIVRGMKSGKLDAPTAKAIIRFINGLADSTVEDTALSMRSGKGTSSFDFGEALTTLFFNQSNDAAQTAIHEFWHGLSRFLPTEEVAKMRKDYQAALAKYLVKNPGFFALVGRYALLPEQFEDYSRMATPTELAQLQGYNAKGAKVDNFAPDADHYKISFTKENYRYVMLDEWIAETMADRVMADQPVTEGFMGQMVAIFRKFWSAMKVALGRDPYERFRQAVMGPDARQQMWRNTPVEKARALWQSDKVATPFNQRFSAIQSQSPAGPFDGDLFSDNPQSPVNQPINSHEYTPIDISGRLSEIQGGAIGAFPGAVAAVAPPDNLAGVVRRFGNETGVGVRFFRIAGPVGEAQTGGFVQPDHPEWIFLNATSPAKASSILAHEWWHSAEKDSAKTKLLEFFAAQVSRLAEPAALDAARKLLAESYEGPFVAVELAANVFSDALTGQSQWGSEVLFSDNWPAVQKLARTLWTKANPLKTSGLKEDADEAIYSQSPADLLAQANASRHSALEAKHNAGTITPAETAQAQALVDEAAKAAGMMEVFHGGDIQGNVIDTSRRERGAISERRDGTFYMSTNPKVAETYPGANNRLFVRINNPFTISTPQKRPASWAGKTAVNRTEQRKSSLSIGEAVDRAKANAYDGVIYGNIVDVGRNYQNGKPADVVGSTVVAFDPNQIKSADPFTGVPLDQRFNTASNSILQSQSPADFLAQANVSMAEVDALAATASAESDGDRTIGDPTRAGGAGTGVESDLNDVMLAASNIYADDIKEMAPQKLADLDAVVRGAMEADPEGNLTRLIRDGMRGVPGNAFDVRMRQMLKEWLARQPATQERREQAAALTMGDHLAKRTASQILGASRDMWVTKAERFRAFMMDHIYTPPPGTRYKILNAPTEEEREALLKKDQERIQRIIDALAKMGVTIEDVLNGGRKLLARRGEMNRTTLKDMDVKKMAAAMDTMDATQSFKDIAAKNGMTVEQVKAAKAEAMAKVMEELRNRRKMAQRAQGIISSQPVTDDPWVTMDFENMAKMSDADAEVEMERIMKELGWFADAQQGKRRTTKRRVPKTPPAGDGSAKGPRKSIPQPELELETVSIFHGMDIGNQVDVVRMKHIVDTASGSSLDVLREIYINWLLSGPVTQATNIVGNVAFGIWNTVLVRAGESTVNAMTGNNLKDSASFGEFIHIFRASVPGMIRGAKMAKMAWGAEHDFFETMGMGDAVGMGGSGLEQLGGRKAISGGKGRVVRMPGRSLMAADSGLKTFFGTMEVAAHAYRLTRKAGIAPGTKAFDDSMNRMMYMAGSPAWDAAVKQAEYNAFQQELNEAKNPIDGIPMWLMELSKSDNWVKKAIGTLFFPFVKTPYNIAKTATVNSPLGTAYLMYLVGKGGLAAFKGGKLTFAGEPEFVTTVARQILAWAAYFALQAISEGDEDDDKKKFLITGSPPKNRGEADLQKRALGGAYMARLGGVSFNYGRLEPFATVVASTVDALRSIKRGDSSPEVVTNVVTSLMYQARNKTFLTGLASIGDILEGRTYGKEYTEILRDKVISSIIPNLVKQPMRNWADTEMDTTDAPWWHSAFPLPSAVGTKLDPATGEEKLRTGNSMTRMLIPSASVPDKKLTLSDKVLLEWNRLRQNDGSNDEEGNPGKAWAPKLPSPTRKLPNQQDIELNEFARNYLVKRRAVLAQKALAGMPLKPDQTSIDLIKKAYSDGSSQAWNEIKYRPSASLGTIKK